MNSSSVRWVQGAVVLHIDPSAVVDAKQLVRDTDYVLLQMMGKIAHHCPLLPVVPKVLRTKGVLLPPKNFGNWPFKD